MPAMKRTLWRHARIATLAPAGPGAGSNDGALLCRGAHRLGGPEDGPANAAAGADAEHDLGGALSRRA
jgi:hypothetical protein